MLVYGDHKENADPRDRLSSLSRQLAAIAAMGADIERHSKLTGALIDAGQLLQGVQDEGFAAIELSHFVHHLARAVLHSWDSRYADIGELPLLPDVHVPSRIEVRLPEGFAFYCIYPESYIEAARRLRLAGAPRVIGIRSIGTTLGAVVAAALGAPPAVTVRPFGDPFARQAELPPAVIEKDVHYVIVDEGPGLSGSSFGAVADWLEARGVPLERIAFVPSHGGDLGREASDAHRRRWGQAQRAPAEFDDRFLSAAFGRLMHFSTGGPWERRKYVATRGADRILLKFAGLGAIGERKLEMARSLHAAGVTPQPFGLVHGFLIEQWCADAWPLAPDDRPVEEIGRYIGLRARLFPAAEASGATIDELLEMCRRNISLAFGEEAARTLDRWNATALQTSVRRVRTDNKLDRHEWLRRGDGRLIKTDALDHHQAHDLIGCQDMAWDVACAIAEFGLNADEAARLIAATGNPVNEQLLDFYAVAYAAFRMARALVAPDITTGPAAESGRQCCADRYARRLRQLVDLHHCLGSRWETSIG